MQSKLFQLYDESFCILCGSNQKLTREHKIKASVIKERLSDRDLLISSSTDSHKLVKQAQSHKSKHLKFNKKICEKCNSSRTQKPDQEFDEFLSKVLPKKINDNEHANFLKENISDNLFRYYAKILCCELADTPAPIPRILADFAIGFTDINPLNMELHFDENGTEKTANRSGLTIEFDKVTRLPHKFVSSHTYENIKFTFSITLLEPAILDLVMNYPDFINKWKEQLETYMKNSPTDQ